MVKTLTRDGPFLQTFSSIVLTSSSAVSFAGTSMGFWPPPNGVYKLNFNVSLNPYNELSGIGGIIQNDQDTLVLAYAGATSVTNPTEAELKVLAKGI